MKINYSAHDDINISLILVREVELFQAILSLHALPAPPPCLSSQRKFATSVDAQTAGCHVYPLQQPSPARPSQKKPRAQIDSHRSARQALEIGSAVARHLLHPETGRQAMTSPFGATSSVWEQEVRRLPPCLTGIAVGAEQPEMSQG